MRPSAPARPLFIHGAGSNAGFWHQQQPHFSNAVYLDLPGHLSPGRGGIEAVQLEGDDYSLAGYSDAVERHIERESEGGVVLVGHSMGGAVALDLALREPLWLQRLVLTNTGARLSVSDELLALLRTDYRAAVEWIVDHSFGAASATTTYAERIARNGTRRKLLRARPEVVLADYVSCRDFDVRSRLSEISVPALVVVGEQDGMTPPHLGRELCDGLPHASLRVIEGAGHMVPIERPEEYNNVVREFFEGRLQG
jgi:pimeloyl-ACP methyl ester carboxylesterase